jgi:hypothetical protein
MTRAPTTRELFGGTILPLPLNLAASLDKVVLGCVVSIRRS